MKKHRSLILAILLLSCFGLSNCYYYKTIESNANNNEEIENIRRTKTIVFIENDYSAALYRVDSLAFTDSTFSGYAYFTIGVHENDQKSFSRKKKKEIEYKIDPLRSVHIVLRSNDMINQGYFEYPLANIEKLEIHEPDINKTRISTIGWTVLGIGAAVGIGFWMFAIAFTGGF